jgi:hypothetical protein
VNLKLKYPTFDLKIKNQNSEVYFFDNIRKNWFILTPEEWVRQHLINFLISEKKIPSSRISIEKEISFNGMKRRYDVVIFDKSLKPLLVAECKAPYVSIDKNVIDQVIRYNQKLKAPYFLVSNGLKDFLFNNSKIVNWETFDIG